MLIIKVMHTVIYHTPRMYLNLKRCYGISLLHTLYCILMETACQRRKREFE